MRQGIKVLVMYVLVYLELDSEFRSTPSNATLKHRGLIPNAHAKTSNTLCPNVAKQYINYLV